MSGPGGAQGTDPAGVVNVLSGTISGPAVQAGTITGGVHFHPSDAPAARIPRQLPASPAHLTGRESELAEIDRLAAPRPTGPALVVIGGVPGIGKSALATAWAQGAAARFADGQLYLPLGALDPAGPVSPGEALGRALRALGVAAERVPGTTAEQATMFRSITAERSLLILLDNAVSAAQVRPLLPASPSCVVLVTARWRLGGLLGDGARFMTVKPLAQQAASALLTSTIGPDRANADPSATTQLVRLCAGLPIALVVTGARLATRPSWPVRRIVSDLAEEHRRLRGLAGRDDVSVQGAFDLSYQHLPAPVARCYRALGLIPGVDFGAPLVATALDMPEPDAASLLESLIESSLLTETAEDRFQIHDLVRLHARQHAEADPERPAMRRRIIEWHLCGALAADRILTPYRRRDRNGGLSLVEGDIVAFASQDDALAWLDRERANLVAAVRHAATDLPLLAWRIADAMWPLFHYRRHHLDRMEVDRIAVSCARRLGDADLEARMLRRWAFAHVDAGELDRARELFVRCLRLWDALGDTYGVAAAAEGLGVVAVQQRRYPEAAEHFGQQLRLSEQAGEQRRCGLALLNLGVVGNESGQFGHAAVRLRRAAAVFADVRAADPYNAARIRIELGRALGRLGDHRRALDELTGALTEMRALGSPRGQAQALHRLGELALADRNIPDAHRHLTDALGIYQDLADGEAVEVSDVLAGLTGRVPPAGADPDRIP
jgi:tetratricopeptide (TPR) repeat protein